MESTHDGLKSLLDHLGQLPFDCLFEILSRRCQDIFLRESLLKAYPVLCLNSVFDLETHFNSAATESPEFWTPEFRRMIDDMLQCFVGWSEGFLTEIRVRHCSDKSLSFVAQRCPNLQVLSIKSCPNVTFPSMVKIASGCPKLTELDISYCYKISHDSLVLIGKSCPNLKILRRNLMNWLDPSQHVGVPNEYLNACPPDGDSEAAAIGKFMPHLLELELRFSTLTAARGLAEISERCLNLEYLDLFGCTNVTSRDIVNATSNMKKLKNVKEPNILNTERYGHWRLYDEPFQADIFQI